MQPSSFGAATVDYQVADMRTLFRRPYRSRWCISGAVSTLFFAGTYAEAACPNYVELNSGTTFSVAAVILDTGSPEAALRKLRGALSQTNAAGGCRRINDHAACEETLAAARKAIAALEACTASPSHG